MDDYVIRCGSLIEGTGAAPIVGARVLISKGRISRVEKSAGTDLDRHPKVVDASGKTVMPGLIDSHKHVLNCGGKGLGVGLTAAQVRENLRQIVRGGVTSVLDLGSGSLIKPVERLSRPNPRIFYAISILTCLDGYPGEYMPRYCYRLGAVEECGTARDIKRAVARLQRKGVSAIKTAVVSRTFDGRPCACWTDSQLLTLTDEAHSLGLKVCAHITYVQDYAQAARCGIDSIHHAAFDGPMRDRDLEEMVRRGVVFVPTLSLLDLMVRGMEENWIAEPAYDPPVNEAIKASMRQLAEAYGRCQEGDPVEGLFIKLTKSCLRSAPKAQVDNVRRYLKLGGRVAMGTDSSLGFSLHTSPYRELELLAEAGLSNLEAIRAATSTAAAVFGKELELGSIEPGKWADILVVDGDPAKDLSALRKVDTAIIGGRVAYKRPAV